MGIGDEEELVGVGVAVGVGVGVGVFVGTVTGQIATSVPPLLAWSVAVAVVDMSGAATSVAGTVPAVTEALETPAVTLVGDGFALVEAEPLGGKHLALEDARGAGVCDWLAEGPVPSWLARPRPDVAPPAVGVLPPPPPACVPSPSGAAPPRAGPVPPFSEVLAWRIAWRTG